MEDALIQLAAKKGVITTVVTGLAKNIQGDTCDVVRDGLPDLLGVSLTSKDSVGDSYLKITPKEDSVVAVMLVNGQKTEGVIVAHSEIEKIEILVNNNNVTIDENGVSIDMQTGKLICKNQVEDLKALLTDFMNAVAAITIPLAPSGTGVPLNIAQLQALAPRVNLLFD